MCVYTYVICVCANVYSMYMYVYLHMSMYPSPPWMWWRGFGGAVNTRHGTLYIYIQLLIHPNSTLEYIYTILMYSVCFVFSYRRTIMFIAFFFVFLRTCPGKLQGHHHDVYIRIALIQVGELQVLFEDGKIDRLVWYICVYIYTHTYMEKDREREGHRNKWIHMNE